MINKATGTAISLMKGIMPTVYRMVKRCVAGLAVFIVGAVSVTGTFAQENETRPDKVFNGGYAGLETARQSFIGGSLVNNIDFLKQNRRLALNALGGYRHQFGPGMMVGVEGSYGITDGDLNLVDDVNQLNITYKNNTQYTYGLMAGLVVGSRKSLMVFGYISEVTRKFDVTIRQQAITFTQRDEQGMLRYGVGIERRLIKRLLLRTSLGSGRADFGDRTTNIKVRKELEAALGLIIQL